MAFPAKPASPVLQRLMHHCQNDSDQKEGVGKGGRGGGSRVWFDRSNAKFFPPLDVPPVSASASAIHQPPRADR